MPQILTNFLSLAKSSSGKLKNKQIVNDHNIKSQICHQMVSVIEIKIVSTERYFVTHLVSS